MPDKRIWTDEENDTLRTLVGQNTATAALAVRFRCCPQHVRQHMYEIGLRPAGWKSRWINSRRLAAVPDAPGPDPLCRAQNWWPLPAGHPESWLVINRGTCLEGAPYEP